MQRLSLRMCALSDGRPKRKLSKQDAARLQQRLNDDLAPGELRTSAYPCSWCGHWHVGRRSWRSENDKRRDRRERKKSAPYLSASVLHDGR